MAVKLVEAWLFVKAAQEERLNNSHVSVRFFYTFVILEISVLANH